MPRKSARNTNMDGVADPLAAQDEDQAALDAGEEATAAAMEAAAAAEAAEAAVDSLGLDSVGVDVHATDGDDEMALAAAAAAAAVQAADGMAVVVDQALLATAAAAAASQVAASMPEPDETPAEFPQEVGDVSVPALPAPKLMDMDHDMYDPDAPEDETEDNILAARRMKDRRRYATMSPTQRAAYNAHRRELYHKQGETARHRRRERERQRYHSLEGEDRKARNARRAKLERDRYQKLSKEELAERNRRRRERAKSRKTNAKRTESTQQQMPVAAAAAAAIETQVPTLPDTSLANPVDMSAVAAEVAEQVIGNAMDDDAQVQV
eukprot:scaffold15645_cov98-Skeletonema_dohrnii-CCMP3373.AAC.2